MTDLKPLPSLDRMAENMAKHIVERDKAEDYQSLVEMVVEDCSTITNLARWALENRRADQWISVEDRLPGENMAVIVHGGVAIMDHGNWYTIMDRGLRNPERIEWTVTHWQPLPVPPLAGEDTNAV